METFLTPEEVAKILNVHSKTIRDWLRSGKLKGIKFGAKCWRITQEDLKQFIDESRANTSK